MHQNTCRGEEMSDIALIRECAAPVMPGESVKAQIMRASRRLRWAYWRTFNAWYGKISLSAEERERARAVMIQNTRSKEAIRHEFQRGLSTIIGAAERFAAVDAEFFGPEIDALRALVSQSGGDDLA